MGKVMEMVRCPVCNRTYPTGFWGKIASVTRDCLGFLMRRKDRGSGFETLKDLVLRREVRPETLAIVRNRLLAALKLWVQKGWLTAEEVRDTLNEVRQDEVSAWRIVITSEVPGFRPVKSTYGKVAVARPLRMPLNKRYEEVII